ncbi:MAG: 50S ribosomal protein L11 [Thermoprotei archaeon]|nr:MAG: 50S ribosomal protein L11 [Thermoprotei archaeon]
MGEKKTFRFLVEGGKASAGPPIGPALGPLGMNLMAVVNEINRLTKDFAGMRVPVDVIVDIETKEFEVKVGTPTTAALIVKEAKITKGSGQTGREWIGNISLEQAIKIALIKKDDINASSLKKAVKTVIGTALSMGVQIEGKSPKEVSREIDEGVYDEIFKQYEAEWGES